MVDDDTQALVDEWGENNVQAAFWLQEHIKNNGLEGIEYIEAGRNLIRSTGESTVRKQMKSQMDNRY